MKLGDILKISILYNRRRKNKALYFIILLVSCILCNMVLIVNKRDLIDGYGIFNKILTIRYFDYKYDDNKIPVENNEYTKNFNPSIIGVDLITGGIIINPVSYLISFLIIVMIPIFITLYNIKYKL